MGEPRHLQLLHVDCISFGAKLVGLIAVGGASVSLEAEIRLASMRRLAALSTRGIAFVQFSLGTVPDTQEGIVLGPNWRLG